MNRHVATKARKHETDRLGRGFVSSCFRGHLILLSMVALASPTLAATKAILRRLIGKGHQA